MFFATQHHHSFRPSSYSNHLDNTMAALGRPKGTKNSPNHRAGGDRRSKDFKAKQQQKRIARMMHQKKVFDEKRNGGSTKKKRTPHPLDEPIFKQSQQMMRDVLDHPSMPKAKNAPTSGTIDNASDEWYINYPDHDDDDEEEEDGVDAARYRASYQPPLQSPLKKCLDGICKKIKKNEHLQKQKYITVCTSSPLASSLGSEPTPDDFYKPDFIVNWDPMKQYPLFEIKYKCPRCKEASMEKKGPCWRPALNWGEVHWIRCHRVSCKACSNTFMTTDSEIMESLPSAIIDDFGYVFPRRGPGVKADMIRGFSLQTNNHILFGAWTKNINGLVWQHYYRRANQYMDLVQDWLDRWPPLATYNGECPMHAWGYDGTPMTPYSAFGEAGHHNGILMTTNIAEQLFFLVEGRKSMEYKQFSFGRWHDAGLRVDDTYKICKKTVVTTPGRKKVNPFSSAATFLNQSGKIVAIAWKMTGSHEVTRDILAGIKLVRDHVGAPPLKVLQTDNPKGEESPFYDVFPSLKDGTISPSSLPAIEIPQDDILVFDSVGPAHNFFLTFASSLPETARDIVYGLDTEFEIMPPQELTVLSLAFPQSLAASDDQRFPRAIVLHLSKMNGSFPASLKQILEQKNWVPVGCQIGGDCSKLDDQYNIKIARRIELQNMCKFDRPELAQIIGGFKLASLMEEYLGCTYPMDKSRAQVQSYRQTLSDVDKQYCALDALVSLWVYEATLSSLSKVGGAHQHMTLRVGKRCTVTFNGRDIAKGQVVFVGTSGEQRVWGGKTLGKAHCLVRIEHLVDKNFVPRRRGDGWPESARTLGELFSCDGVTLELAMEAKQVKILEEVELSPDDSSVATHGDFEVDQSYMRKLIDRVQRSEDNQDQTQTDGDESKFEDLDSFLTRSTRDFFHELHSMPMGKKQAGTPSVLQLCIAGSEIYSAPDYENVTRVLQAKGEDIMLHQQFNRDYWRRRVPRARPLPKEHGNNIRMIYDIVNNSDAYEEVRSPELMKWLLKFADNAESGLYYQPTDINMYKLDRVDKDGLNVYKTESGTNLNETVHQKLADLLGCMVAGVKIVDLLLVLRAFRYNVSVGISRCGEPDFQTDRHDIVDKTQHSIMHIFGIFAWPTHTNLLDFKPPENSTLVGCRPLPFDENHVTRAPRPAGNLSRDHAYLSQKLGVHIAPLPLSTKDEFKLYNSLVRQIVQQNRNPNNNDFDNIARAFKQKVDGSKIFPKTVHHLKKYYTTWKHVQMIRLFNLRARTDTASLMERFRSAFAAPPKLITTKLPAKVQTVSYTARKPLEKMENVVPPDSAFTQERHVALESKEVKKKKLADLDTNTNTYQQLQRMSKTQLRRQSQRCAWFPYCPKQVWTCGGYNRTLECSFISRLTPQMREEVKLELSKNTINKKSLARKRQRDIKRCIRDHGTLDVPVVADTITVPCVYHSRQKTGYIVTEEMMKEVATIGMPVQNACVSAYLSLFINKVNSSGMGNDLGLVDPGFVGHLSGNGFGSVHNWLTNKGVELIPAFFGPHNYGHWAALILDSKCSDQHAVVAFVDSLGGREGRFQAVKRDLVGSHYEEARQVMIDSPTQAAVSNDCGFFTMGAFVHWTLRGTKDVPTAFRLRDSYNASTFGIQMRKHVYMSIVNGTVDLDDPVLSAMELSYPT